MIDTIYILGAGASADSGIPVMSNFVQKAESLAASKEFEGYEFKELKEIIDNLQFGESKIYIDSENIESVLGAIEMAEIFNHKFKEDQSIDLKNTYIDYVVKTIEKSTLFKYEKDKITNEKSNSYDAFVKNYITPIKNKSAILTFNYDVCLDIALYSNNVSFNYYLEANRDDNFFPYLKLHGSINWFEIEKQNNNTEINILDVMSHVKYGAHFTDKKHIKRRVDDYFFQTHFKKEMLSKKYIEIPKSKMNTLIIPPTWNKTMYHNKIKNVWVKAHNVFRNTKNIVVIGYSYPESDSFFKYMLSVCTNNNTRINKLIIVNPNIDPIKERLDELLGPALKKKVSYVNLWFEDFAKRTDLTDFSFLR